MPESMEIKTFVGYGYGRFENDRGQKQDYCSVFMLEDFSGEQNDDYHFGGLKAVKYGCTSPEVFANVKQGSRVTCYFDSKKRCCHMQLWEEPKAAAAK